MSHSHTLDVVGQLLADRPAFHVEGTAHWDVTRGTLHAVRNAVRPGDRTLEIGAGVTTVVFAAAGARHTAVSPDPSEHQLIRNYCRKIGVDDSQLEFLVGFSDDILPSHLTRERTLDVALVDGAHSFPLPIIDWHYVSRAVKVGGRLFLDDITIPAVKPAFRHMTLDSAWRLDGIFNSQCAAFTLLREPGLDGDYLNQPFNRGYPDYSFVGMPRRVLLHAYFRTRSLRRALGERFPELRRRYISRF
jgi:precorrin-6B methylase 2